MDKFQIAYIEQLKKQISDIEAKIEDVKNSPPRQDFEHGYFYDLGDTISLTITSDAFNFPKSEVEAVLSKYLPSGLSFTEPAETFAFVADGMQFLLRKNRGQ